MKKAALAIITILIGFSSIAQTADSAASRRNKPDKVNKHFKGQDIEKLNLTDDQKAQMKSLNESFRQQMQELSKNTNVSADELKSKHDALIKDHRERMNAILTAKQRTQMQAMKQEYGHGKDRGARSRRFEEMTKNLNLTPEQSAKMETLSKKLKTDIQSIRQNTALGQGEKKDQMRALMKKHKEDMESLLTDEQKEQLKNNFKNKRREVVRS